MNVKAPKKPEPTRMSPAAIRTSIALKERERKRQTVYDLICDIPLGQALSSLLERLNATRRNSITYDRICDEAAELDLAIQDKADINNYYSFLLYYASFVASPIEISTAYTDSIRINGACFGMEPFLLQLEEGFDPLRSYSRLKESLHRIFATAAKRSANPYRRDIALALAEASLRNHDDPETTLKKLRAVANRQDIFNIPTDVRILNAVRISKSVFVKNFDSRLQWGYYAGSELVVNRSIEETADSAIDVSIGLCGYLPDENYENEAPLLTIARYAVDYVVEADNNLHAVVQEVARAFYDFKKDYGTCPMALTELGDHFDPFSKKGDYARQKVEYAYHNAMFLLKLKAGIHD